MSHEIEIKVNGWKLADLQRGADELYQQYGLTVDEIWMDYRTRREYIHLLDLERKLQGYESSFADDLIPVIATGTVGYHHVQFLSKKNGQTYIDLNLSTGKVTYSYSEEHQS